MPPASPEQPVPFRDLLTGATQGPWTHDYSDDSVVTKDGTGVAGLDIIFEPQDAAYIARLSPDVMLKVVEALEISERYLWNSPLDGALVAHAKVQSALSALSATPSP